MQVTFDRWGGGVGEGVAAGDGEGMGVADALLRTGGEILDSFETCPLWGWRAPLPSAAPGGSETRPPCRSTLPVSVMVLITAPVASKPRPATTSSRQQPTGAVGMPPAAGWAARRAGRAATPSASGCAAGGIRPPGPGHEAGRTRSASSRCAHRGLCLSSDASPVSGLDWAKQPRFACAAPSGSCIRAPTAVAVAVARGTHAASLIATGDSSGQGKLSITRELRCCNPCTRRTASREAWVWLMEPAPRVAGAKAGRHMCDWLGEGSGQR